MAAMCFVALDETHLERIANPVSSYCPIASQSFSHHMATAFVHTQYVCHTCWYSPYYDSRDALLVTNAGCLSRNDSCDNGLHNLSLFGDAASHNLRCVRDHRDTNQRYHCSLLPSCDSYYYETLNDIYLLNVSQSDLTANYDAP